MNKQKSLTVNDITLREMSEHFENRKRINIDPTVYFRADVDGATITAFNTGKVVFQGKRADIYYDIWVGKNLHNRSNIEREELLSY